MKLTIKFSDGHGFPHQVIGAGSCIYTGADTIRFKVSTGAP